MRVLAYALFCVLVSSCAIENRALTDADDDPDAAGGAVGLSASGRAGDVSTSGGAAATGGMSPSVGGATGSSLAGSAGRNGSSGHAGSSGANSSGGAGAGGNLEGLGGATSAGSAGIPSNAGAANGGQAGSASGGQAGGGSIACTSVSFPFTTSVEGWAVLYGEPGSLAASSTLKFQSSQGSPALGALQLGAPFSAPNQKVEVAIGLASTDFHGQTLVAFVKVQSGLAADPSNPGGAKLYLKTGAQFAYADGGWFNLTSAWTKVQLVVDKPSGFVQTGYDPRDARELGIEIDTGSGGQYKAAVILLDSVACAP